jgi:hypothetical protein
MTHPRAPFAALALLLAAPALAQTYQPSVGLALWQAGYRATVAAGDLYFHNGERANGTLNPSSALICTGPCAGGRYGWDRHVKGYLVGPEGTSRDQAQAALDSGCLSIPGIPAGYVLTELDYLDLMYVRYGSTSWYAARVGACRPRVPVDPVATPTPRPTPSPTASPPPPPVATPTPCPVVTCPTYQPATVPAAVVTRLHATLAALDRLAALNNPLIKWGEGRRALVRDSRAAIAEVEALLGTFVSGLYRPVDGSTGVAVTTTVEGEQR